MAPDPQPVPPLTSAWIEGFIRGAHNPFDLLLEARTPALLDLGAGDLSFAAELVDQYLPRLSERQKSLTVHCVDRIHPDSQLGPAYQPDKGWLTQLRHRQSSVFQFQYWGNQDMFELGRLEEILPRYTIVTCSAPPTPTVAYEPTRVSRPLIDTHLQKTKGAFRKVRVEGEEALEVLHGGRALLFPPWKFDIRGPLALLDLLSRKGQLCILAAVDNEVFWELLAQLLAEERFRPRNITFGPSIVRDVFGEVYRGLAALPIGGSLALADLAELREDIPRVLDTNGLQDVYGIRHVEVRRGALFEGLPASSTAHLFKDMKEEQPPWMLILVPEEPHG
jgi:hypothetical protein